MADDEFHTNYHNGRNGRNEGYFTLAHHYGRVDLDRANGTNETGFNPPPVAFSSPGGGFFLFLLLLLGGVAFVIAWIYASHHNGKLPPLGVLIFWEVVAVAAIAAAFFGFCWLFDPTRGAKRQSAPVARAPQPQQGQGAATKSTKVMLNDVPGASQTERIVRMIAESKRRGKFPLYLTGGDAAFQAEAWLEAQRQGIEIANYKPSPKVQARREEWNQRVAALKLDMTEADTPNRVQ